MITFNLEQPLLLKDIDEAIHVKRQESKRAGLKDRRDGLIVLAIGVAILCFFGFSLTRENDPYRLKFIFLIFWSMYTFTMLFIPLMLSSRIDGFITSPYKEASLDRLHDCKAFISMPGMEKYKEYAENVNKQGRELTYFECDEILKYWKSLASK
jgi:hypothetical protein